MRRQIIEFLFPWVKHSRLRSEEAQRIIDECERKIEENNVQIQLHTRNAYACCLKIVKLSKEEIAEIENTLKIHGNACSAEQLLKLFSMKAKYEEDVEKYSKEAEEMEREGGFMRGMVKAEKIGIL